MFRNLTLAVIVIALTTAVALADELTEIVQKDLVALGFDPGRIDGEMTTETAVAISQYQAQNNLEVTGKPTPQLAGIMKASLTQRNNPGGVASAPAVAAAAPADLQAAQQACLQRKVEKAQAKQEKKRGLSSLVRAASRVSSRFGDGEAARSIQEVSTDVYVADATSSDLKSAAKDLGLKQKDIEACRNPAM